MGGSGGKNIPRIRLTLAKVLVEVEAELGNLDKSLKGWREQKILNFNLGILETHGGLIFLTKNKSEL